MNQAQGIRRMPAGLQLRPDVLQDFERELDTESPECGGRGVHVLGYGEISTVFEVQQAPLRGWAMKRMSVFVSEHEVHQYAERYETYNRLLTESVGLKVPDHGYVMVRSRVGRPILYLLQRKVPVDRIATHILRHLADAEARACLHQVFAELQQVWKYNAAQGRWRVAIDGQLSNWAFLDTAGEDLVYLDTSTPLFRVDGVEQLDPELFLRSAPSFLVWILRLLFLKDVMERYYRPRQILLDVIANLHKERLQWLIPAAIAEAEPVLARWAGGDRARPITVKEVDAYYREDALIWTLFLGMRRLDRFLHRHVYGREYPYILPGVIRR